MDTEQQKLIYWNLWTTTSVTDNARACLRDTRKPIAKPRRRRVSAREIRPHKGGWQCYEAPGVGPYWTGETAKEAPARTNAARRGDWARLRHAQRAAALYESQAMRTAGRKALKPQPTHQAKLVIWHLTTRVPLTFAAIPENEIASACEKFNMPGETWRRQERAFVLMRKVYERRAKIRGEQPIITKPAWASEQANDTDDEYGY